MSSVKKALCILLSLLFVFSLTACGGEDEQPKETLSQYAEKNKDSLIGVFHYYIRESNLTSKSELRVEDKTIVMDFRVYEFDNLSDDEKYRIQRSFTDISSEVEKKYEKYAEEALGLEKIIINILETDGDSVASIKMNF